MNYEFKKCVENRKLVKIKSDKRLVEKEMKSAKYDLEKAKESLHSEDYKWCTIKSYYSMFHCCRALILSKGYRERSHRCLLIALQTLFKNVLDGNFIRNFEDAMDLREQADYEFKFSKESAEDVFENAEKFLEKTQRILH